MPCLPYGEGNFAKLPICMSRYIFYFCQWQMSIAAIAKFVLFSMLLVCATQHHVWSQSQPPTENLKLYEQAASHKEYAKASQYAYEIATYYQQAKDPIKSLEYLNFSLAH